MSGPELDVKEQLRVLAQADADRGATPAVEHALMAAFRQRHTAPMRKAPLRLSWKAWSAVASVAAALAWVAIRGGTEDRTRPPVSDAKRETATVRPQEPPAVAAATAGKAEARVAARRKGAGAARRARPAVRSVTAEPATGFYALAPDVNDETLRGMPLLRVRMPRSVLATFGLPVDPEKLDRPVKADLALGEDGTARAIRFVSTY